MDMGEAILITGGAGFVGINAAKAFLDRGYAVIIYDDFSRRGSRQNVDWLRSQVTGNIRIVTGTLFDFEKLKEEAGAADAVIHLAAQVAVTTSVENPRMDFEINCLGSFNVIEAVRQTGKNPVVIYSSTNKVYGGMEQIEITEGEERFSYTNNADGIDESTRLDFHSPYGCSKGAADQYFHDYSRIYGLRSVVFRQSCIYGRHQFGNQDQGWVAHFVISALAGRQLQICGNGKQVRDLLFVDDLCDLYIKCVQNPDAMIGRVYNIGGGASNAISILDLVRILEDILSRKIGLSFGPWRPGDQRIYISDISAIFRDCGWKPKITPEVGIREMVEWVRDNIALFNDRL